MIDLIFSDLHLHTYPRFGYDSKSRISVRLKEQGQILSQINDIIESRGVNRVFFGGDFFHQDKQIPTECLNYGHMFIDSIRSLGVEFYACRGNHDLTLKDSSHPVHYSLGTFGVHTTPPKGVYFAHYDEPLDVNNVSGYELVLVHKTPIGCELHNHIFTEGVDWKTLATSNKLVLFGHIHQKQILSDNCIVMGTPMHLTFGDQGPRGVYLTEGDKLEFIELRSPKFLTVNTSEEAIDDSNYYRVLSEGKNSIDGKVVCIKKPTYHETRIKSTNFVDILKEWLQLQGKDETYLSVIHDLLQQETFTTKKIGDFKLRRVEIENFLSVEKVSLDIQNGFNLIEGKNGSGKSSLMDSIFWCLFNETTKGLTGDSILRKFPEQQKDCKVTLFLQGESTYKIQRSRKSGLAIYDKANPKRDLLSGFKMKDAQSFLERLLGFDKSIFLSSVYFSQEEVLLLTRLGQADKNSMITNLLGFSRYEDLSDAVSTKIAEKTEALSTYKESIEKLQTRNQWLRDSLVKTNASGFELIKRGEEVKEEGTKLKVEVMKLQKWFMENEKPKEVDTSHLVRAEEVARGNRTELENSIVGYELSLNRLDLVKLVERVARLDSAVVSKISELEKITREINLLESSSGKICTHCGMTMTGKHREEYLTKLTKELEAVEEDRVQLVSQREVVIEEKLSLQAQQEMLKGYIEGDRKSIRLLTTELVELVKQKEQLTAALTDRKERENFLLGQKEKLDLIQKNFNQLRKDFEAVQDQVRTDQEEVSQNELTITTTTYVSTATQEELDRLLFWKEAFSYKGVRSLLIDSFCNDVNGILSELMGTVSSGAIQVEFSPIGKTKGGEERNRLDLVVTIDDVQQEYLSLSGGEKSRVDFSVCIAFSRWIQDHYKLSTTLLGLLIMDELLEHVDEEGLGAIEDILAEEGRTKSVFAITHTKGLSARADRVISIKKNNRVSEVL